MPKILLYKGKGSVVVPSFSYLRVAKMTQAWQGKARHEEAREREFFILTESVKLHFTIQVDQKELIRTSLDRNYCKYIG